MNTLILIAYNSIPILINGIYTSPHNHFYIILYFSCMLYLSKRDYWCSLFRKLHNILVKLVPNNAYSIDFGKYTLHIVCKTNIYLHTYKILPELTTSGTVVIVHYVICTHVYLNRYALILDRRCGMLYTMKVLCCCGCIVSKSGCEVAAYCSNSTSIPPQYFTYEPRTENNQVSIQQNV